MTTETFRVPEVSCGHCKSTIEGALQPLSGVTQALVDIDDKTVAVDFDDRAIGRADIVATIESAGYEVAL
jgi:copper chaperone